MFVIKYENDGDNYCFTAVSKFTAMAMEGSVWLIKPKPNQP